MEAAKDVRRNPPQGLVMDKEILLNNFATRSFRDVADYDYIAARMAYRAKLIPQFLWSGLQAIEKYLKCILLLNRIPAKTLRHDLGRALELVETGAPFKLRLREPGRELIRHLDTYGRFRYLETPFHVMDLDRATRYGRLGYSSILPSARLRDKTAQWPDPAYAGRRNPNHRT
jgi:hypothetical protein